MQQIKRLLTDEEQANMQLLEISDGIVKGVTDPDKLIGSLVLPDGITQIGDEAFSGCTNLKTVIIDSAFVEKIKDTAFANVHADIHFTVKTDAVKAMLKENFLSIRDECITVE